MNKWTEIQLGLAMVREYLPTLRKTASSKKGSPTLEYVVIIAVGATFAGILLNVFKTDEGNSIANELTTKVKNMITNSGDLVGGGSDADAEAKKECEKQGGTWKDGECQG
ncbi:hypothetical protein [Mechercharimyces sp. CAU 1602]|uniref:hypothetical protein n=1 Tax=Mechercharimyces sp. CAU 1602 TaxID=2973933 RepID=UPI0021626A6A|nr:hypothetical protein [Mechercharimyces sp. CAU 1602]MCS1352433.1 hypothetical protein [Mechercharimyces sp. CAU 1602]